jgi:hypothetical protein
MSMPCPNCGEEVFMGFLSFHECPPPPIIVAQRFMTQEERDAMDRAAMRSQIVIDPGFELDAAKEQR